MILGEVPYREALNASFSYENISYETKKKPYVRYRTKTLQNVFKSEIECKRKKLVYPLSVALKVRTVFIMIVLGLKPVKYWGKKLCGLT